VTAGVKIVLGIGNPGRDYAATRHNVGFRVVDLLAEANGVEVRRRRFRGLLGEGTVGRERVLLVKPQTYVNLSGECARAVLGFYKEPPESLMVVADDVNLRLGQLRCRRQGTSGGHNGLESVAACLGTTAFPRLRVGVGRPGAQADDEDDGGRSRDIVGHVLGGFSREELPVAEEAEARAAEAVTEWIGRGVEACMNRFNAPPPGSGDTDPRGAGENGRTEGGQDE